MRCAYRLFDVDDLIVNTLGALGGSLLAFVFLDRKDQSTPPLPTTVSLGRRLVGLASDAIFSLLLGGTIAAAYRGWGLYGPGSFDRDVQTLLLLGVPYVVQLVTVLATGRTVGEHVVAVRPVARRPRQRWLARVVKLSTGVTPAFAVIALSDFSTWWVAVGLPLVVVVNIVVAWRSEQHRGLSHVLAGMDLGIAADEHLDREDVGVAP